MMRPLMVIAMAMAMAMATIGLTRASTPGGLDELKTQLGSNDIRYAVLEALVTGDDYNAVKYVLITWIGPDVSAGTSLPPSLPEIAISCLLSCLVA